MTVALAAFESPKDAAKAPRPGFVASPSIVRSTVYG
jgi:hypothetical protein